MPRPISWLPRLAHIRRAVANSSRSHYDRRDLELLFELQPRAAQKLLEILPTVAVGTSHLVEREVLAGFLDRVRETEDLPSLYDQMRQEKAAPKRKKLRSLVRRDTEPASLASLPESIALSRGRLEVRFRSLEQLAEAMYAIARLLQDESAAFAFAYAYEPETEPDAEDPDDVRELFAELEVMEATTP